MYVKDFTYDGVTLSSLGYTVCSFDNGGERATGSELTLNTVPIQKGAKYLLADYKYDKCLETTFHICKIPCVSEQTDLIITPAEFSELSRWLNKKNFRPMIFNATGWTNITFEASFNVSAVLVGGDIYGLELVMRTNRPFAMKNEVTATLSFSSEELTQRITDTSDEIGYIYPSSIEVTCGASGDLVLTNAIENRVTRVKNCTSGEKITFVYPSITSSNNGHTTLLDDFNYIYPRIANSAESKVNAITASMPCTMVIKYRPIIKIAI